MRKAQYILFVMVMALTGATLMSAGEASGSIIKATMDSAYIIMGKTTPVHVELTIPAGNEPQLVVKGNKLTEEVEVASVTKPEIADAGNGMQIWKQDVVIQAFDSGAYTIPAIQYIVAKDTLKSASLTLSVNPVNVDSMTTVHPMAAPATISAHFWDWVPDWIADYAAFWIAALLFIAAVWILYVKWWKKREKAPVEAPKPVVKVIPPYELALQRLRSLHDEQVWEKGNDREFYTRLTDILREYIDARFNINAMEMTSAEILDALSRNPQTRLPEQYMRQVLEIADFVKFAKMRPFSEDNVKAYDDAIKFVEGTKPLPSPTGINDSDKANNK